MRGREFDKRQGRNIERTTTTSPSSSQLSFGDAEVEGRLAYGFLRIRENTEEGKAEGSLPFWRRTSA